MVPGIQHILCPIDFSDTSINAFRYALGLAEAMGAKVQLLHVVIPEVEALDLPVVAAEATRTRIETARTMMETLVEEEAQAFRKEGREAPVVEMTIEVGAPGGTILDVARRDGASLVLMGTRREHNLLDRLFGSVTQHVVERSERPVWVVPHDAAFAPLRDVAFAAQLTEADPWYIYQTIRLLGTQVQRLHVVHVHREGDHDYLHCEDLEAFFAERQQGPEVRCHQLEGADVAEKLNAFVEEHGIRLLVLWSRHRNLLERLFTGSEATELAWQTRVPLLVCRSHS